MAGDAGVAQEQQGRFLGGEERLGKKKWLDSPSARPLLLTGVFDFSPNRIIRVQLESDIPIKWEPDNPIYRSFKKKSCHVEPFSFVLNLDLCA